MRVFRCYTKENRSPYSAIAFQTANSEIRNPDGSIVFSASNIKVPRDWSQVAIDVLAQKYFRKAGVPAITRPKKEKGIPDWLLPKEPDEAALDKLGKDERFGGETRRNPKF
jgi:Class II vitamin B12-dependent ribonucleotide reductase.